MDFSDSSKARLLPKTHLKERGKKTSINTVPKNQSYHSLWCHEDSGFLLFILNMGMLSRRPRVQVFIAAERTITLTE